MHAIPTLPNGAPGQRLRHLVKHFHAFGPRALEDFFERLIDGRLVGAPAIVEELEYAARLDPAMMKAIGGFKCESPVSDWTWIIEMDRRSGRPPRPRGRPRRPPSSRGMLRLVPPSLEPQEDQAVS
jgi:hypothetical protein